jgi:hypothetical protein
MARPRKSTLDEWLSQFGSWNAENRAGALAQAQDAHRWITFGEGKTARPTEPNETDLPLLDEIPTVREKLDEIVCGHE